jgi:hypothetical protein
MALVGTNMKVNVVLLALDSEGLLRIARMSERLANKRAPSQRVVADQPRDEVGMKELSAGHRKFKERFVGERTKCLRDVWTHSVLMHSRISSLGIVAKL